MLDLIDYDEVGHGGDADIEQLRDGHDDF